MNILLIGSGGREHALALKLSQSRLCSRLFIAPGNAGTASCGSNLDISPTDFDALIKACLDKSIGLVIVGPEEPLVKGLVDVFAATPGVAHIPVIGPSEAGARLEGSKDFAKAFMSRHSIPTAAYASFNKSTLKEGHRFLASLKPPYVLKADGLAAGKGVLIIDDLDEACTSLTSMLDGMFGQAGNTVVIEEFLKGIELSVFVFTDGADYKIFPEAKDYKRIGDGDTGLNTGGMGAVSPVPFADATFMKKVEDKIVRPTVMGLKSEGIRYVGWVFIGLMNVSGEPYVIEYNVRLGDPETEVVIPRIRTDLVELLLAAANGKLKEVELEVDSRTAVTVMLVSGGYPGSYEKGKTVSGLEAIHESTVFHAGTSVLGGNVVTSGGRVLAVTSMGNDLSEAREKSYRSIEDISFEGMYYRKDIGSDLL
ncbi:MAG: phosphoribosylamine--glycine ligase [Bacteroidota bacterium]